MANFGNDRTLVADGTVVTASGTGSLVIKPFNKGIFRGVLNVTAISGTSASLTVTVETSYDSGATDSWRAVSAFTAATATGTQRKSFVGIDRYVRVSYVVSGTSPSITFGVSGEVV